MSSGVASYFLEYNILPSLITETLWLNKAYGNCGEIRISVKKIALLNDVVVIFT